MKEKRRDTMKKKREDEKENYFFKKSFKTLKPARWISPKMFPPFFFECSESNRVFNYLHNSNSIFRAR